MLVKVIEYLDDNEKKDQSRSRQDEHIYNFFTTNIFY